MLLQANRVTDGPLACHAGRCGAPGSAWARAEPALRPPRRQSRAVKPKPWLTLPGSTTVDTNPPATTEKRQQAHGTAPRMSRSRLLGTLHCRPQLLPLAARWTCLTATMRCLALIFWARLGRQLEGMPACYSSRGKSSSSSSSKSLVILQAQALTGRGRSWRRGKREVLHRREASLEESDAWPRLLWSSDSRRHNSSSSSSQRKIDGTALYAHSLGPLGRQLIKHLRKGMAMPSQPPPAAALPPAGGGCSSSACLGMRTAGSSSRNSSRASTRQQPGVGRSLAAGKQQQQQLNPCQPQHVWARQAATARVILTCAGASGSRLRQLRPWGRLPMLHLRSAASGASAEQARAA